MTRLCALLLVLTACAADPTAADDGGDILDGKGDGSGHAVPWSVSRHVWPSDSRARITQDLALIAELGATYVRTDVWWYSVEPARGQYNQAALDFYSWYVDEAARHHLSVLAILSAAPDWAKALHDSDRTAFVTAFGNYSERVAATFGDRVRLYQLWNEPNHVIDVPNSDTDIALFKAARAGITRGAPGVTVRTAINVLVDGHDGPIGRWEDDVRYYLDHGARAAVDIIAIDHYPGTWSIGDWGGNVVERLFAVGREQNKAIAIFEAGYSTSACVLPLNTEAGQVGWIREQVPRMRAKIMAGMGAQFALVNWFKLDDRNSANCWDPEDNFGIVHTDRTKKPAFAALRAEIAKFR